MSPPRLAAIVFSSVASLGMVILMVDRFCTADALRILLSAWPVLAFALSSGILFVVIAWPLLVRVDRAITQNATALTTPPSIHIGSPYRKAIERESASPGPPEDRLERVYVEAYMDGAKAERETILREAKAIRDRIGHPEANIGSGARAIVKAIEDRDTFAAVPTAAPPAKHSA